MNSLKSDNDLEEESNASVQQEELTIVADSTINPAVEFARIIKQIKEDTIKNKVNGDEKLTDK